MIFDDPNGPREYDPYSDPNWGAHEFKPIHWESIFLRVYMAKLAKGWPAQLAARAGRRAERGESRWGV